MVIRYQEAVDQAGPGKEKQTAGKFANTDKDDACRCKEASEMKPRELLKLMMKDLAFWKKPKKV